MWFETVMDAGFIQLGASVGTAGVMAATWAHAALRPESQLFGRTLIAGSNPRQMALTFDDGPNDACTEALLDVLARHGATAAFFMIGRFARQRPDLVRAVHAAGHVVGNHTDAHPWLAWQSGRRIREEIYACNAALEDILGVPVRYFRPPHGARRPAVLRTASELGLTTVQWNVMGYDWEPLTAAQIAARVNAGIERARQKSTGSNILLHDGWDVRMGGDRHATLEAADRLLRQFARDGDTVVSLDAWR
jgi:peptidoglycan/xylan/chitin deacetylase (PgdA/CDA1 family)